MESDLIIRLKKLIGNDSNVAFAKKVGLSEGGIRHILKGQAPSLETLSKIARACNVRMSWLVGDSPINMLPGEDVVLVEAPIGIKESVPAELNDHNKQLNQDVALYQAPVMLREAADINMALLEVAVLVVHRYCASEVVVAAPERMAKLIVAIYKYAAAKGSATPEELDQFLKLIV